MAAPSRTSDAEIRDIVLNRAPWIVKRMSELPEEPLPRRFVTGETLPYLGRNVEMIIEPGEGPSSQLRLDGEMFRVSVPPCLDDVDRAESIRKAFAAWYRAVPPNTLLRG